MLLSVRANLVGKRMVIHRALQAELTEARKKRPLYTQMRRQATTIQDWVQGGQSWLQHYACLSAISPAARTCTSRRFKSPLKERFASPFRRGAARSWPGWTNSFGPRATR
ncbi:MAG: hypothetical protein MZV64_71020 [Ignavibacteriales bacterium]|nr:hypothetical protein [Ignavibacteriales bacterium]